MIFVWFIYGLAFFILGLSIIVYPKKDSAFKLAKYFWWVAAFGILHGVNEWLDMFIGIGEPFPPDVLKLIRIFTLIASFLCLVQFGSKVLAEDRKRLGFLEFAPIVLFCLWAFFLVVSEQKMLTADIMGRYLLCAPGTFLTAIALFAQVRQFKKMHLPVVTANLKISGVTFVLYGVLAGLIVKKADFFAANFLNYDTFEATVGAPVQIFRAICAIVLAGSTTYVLSVFRWETQEALRKSELRCGTVASVAPIILFVLDRDSKVTFIQGKGLELLGLKAEDVTGNRLSEVLPSVPQLEEDTRRASAGQDFVTTVMVEGVIFEFCYSGLRDSSGDITGSIGIALDVTSRVKAEQELLEYRSKLEKNARLAEIGTMASGMAHKLDEPLAVTKLLLQRVLSEFDQDAASNELTIGLKKSLSEVTSAADIVERFRGFAQVTGDKGTRPVDLYAIVKRIMAVFAQGAQSKNLRISAKGMDVVPSMSIPIHQLEQIFFIMVQHAVDEGDPEKEEKLVMNCHAGEKDIEICFTYSGVGIEPEKLEHYFDGFFRDELQAQGRSLGLAIAKQIVTANGGEMVAQREGGPVATCLVRLPIERIV
jgi:PAS domain S-box-containing protein